MTSVNDFTGIITLSLATPPGISANLQNNVVLLGPTSTVTIGATADSVGNYTFTLTASSGRLSHSVNLAIIAQGVSFTSSPNPLVYFQNLSANSTLTLRSLNGFSGNLTLYYYGGSGYFSYAVITPKSVIMTRNGLATVTVTVKPDLDCCYHTAIPLDARSSLGDVCCGDLFVVINESLTLRNYSVPSSTDVILNFTNNGAFWVGRANYTVADGFGDKYTSLNDCCSIITGLSTSTFEFPIGAQCTLCTLSGNAFSYSTGNSYTITFTTFRHHNFSFLV